jgi:hypothetical protein
MEYLGLYNKPKAEVHPGHKLTGPIEEEKEEEKTINLQRIIGFINYRKPIPVVARSKAWVLAPRLLGWLSVPYKPCLLLGRSLCDGPILRTEDSYRACVCH